MLKQKAKLQIKLKDVIDIEWYKIILEENNMSSNKEQKILNQLLQQQIIYFIPKKKQIGQLRGGGCGTSIEKPVEDKFSQTIELPDEFLDKLRGNCKLLVSNSQMLVNDQYSLTSIFIALQWFHYNSEFINLCCQRGKYVKQVYELFLGQAEEILSVFPNYLRSQGFIAYRILQIVNDLLRVVFSFQVKNPNQKLDEKKKDQLIELVETIKSELEIESKEIWKTGVEYEITLIEIMIHNCNINFSKGQDLFISFINSLVQSALTCSIQDSVMETLINLAGYLINIPFEKLSYPKEVYIQYYYFQTLKWMIINALGKEQTIKTQIEKLISIYKSHVLESTNWIIHYTWIQMICDLLSYRVVVFRDTFLKDTPITQRFEKWNFMVEKNLIKPLPQQKQGVISLYTNYLFINFDQKNYFQQKIGGLQIFCDFLQQGKFEDELDFWKTYTRFSFSKKEKKNDSKLQLHLQDQINFKLQTIILQNINQLENLFVNYKKEINELDFKLYQNELETKTTQLWNNSIQLIYILQEINEKSTLILRQIELISKAIKEHFDDGTKLNEIIQIQSTIKEKCRSLVETIQSHQIQCLKIELLCKNLKVCSAIDFKKIQFENDKSQYINLSNQMKLLIDNDKSFRQKIINHFVLKESRIPQMTFQFQDVKELIKLPQSLISDQYSKGILQFLKNENYNIENYFIETKKQIKFLQIFIQLCRIRQSKTYEILQNFEIVLPQNTQGSNAQAEAEAELPVLKNIVIDVLENVRTIFQLNYVLENTEISDNMFQQKIKIFSQVLEHNSSLIASIDVASVSKEQAKALQLFSELQTEVLPYLSGQLSEKHKFVKKLESETISQLKKWKDLGNQTKQELEIQAKKIENDNNEKTMQDLQQCEKELHENISKLEEFLIFLKIEENVKNSIDEKAKLNKIEYFKTILKNLLSKVKIEIEKIEKILAEEFSLNYQNHQVCDGDLYFLLIKCSQQLDCKKYNIDELYCEIDEVVNQSIQIKGIISSQGGSHKVRECLVVNLLKIQASISEEKIIKFVQWQIKQMWVLEQNEEVRGLLKNKDLLEMQKKLFQKDLKSFSQQIQSEMQENINKLETIEQQLRLEGNQETKEILQNQLKLAYQEMDQYLENISDMSSQMNISLVFLKEITKDLKSIKSKIDALSENVNQIANDVRKLRGKTFQQLLEIRKNKVLHLASEYEVDSIYIPLKTIEINSRTGDKIKSNKGNDASLLLVEKFSNPKSEESLVGELNEFLWGKEDQKRDVFLIRGQAGSGKSRSVRKIEEFLWKIQDYEPKWIPIYGSLPQIKNPKFNLFEQALDSEYYNFDSAQTKEFKKAIRKKKVNLIFIFDSYDEMKIDCIQQNLIMTNNFISDFEIDESGKFVKFIFTTRSEILNSTNYRNQFFGNSLDSLKDVELIKFDQDQVDDYLKKYVQLSAKRVIRGLYELIKEINQLKFNSDEFKLIWEMVEPTVIECNTQSENQQMLFENREDDAIIAKIKSHKVFQHLKDEQIILLKKDLQQLWSGSMFKQSIKNVNIEQLITTPFMLEIVVQVLPLMITRDSNTYIFKEIFLKNLTILLKQSSKSKKYLSRYQQKKDKDKNIDKEEVKCKVIFEKLQEKKFFLNYSPLYKMSIQDDSIIFRQNRYEIENPDLVLAALKLKQFTAYEFYDCFITNYHNWQIQKLMQLGKITNYDQFSIDVFNFSQSLALDLTTNQQVQINIKKKGKLKLNIFNETQQNVNAWEDQYISDLDDNLDYMKLIRSCALISIKGSSLSFNHKSIQEFLVAKFIYDEISKMNLSIKSQKINQENVILKSLYNQNEFNISKENYYGVIALLKSQLENLPEIDELLIYSVNLSVNENFIRQASNSIYLLGQRNKFLGGMKFQNIKLKDTNLFALSFFGSDLSGSIFENVIIDSCNFNFCDLDNTKWDNIVCKEMPYLKGHQGTVFQVAFSHDGQLLASGGSDSLVRIWNLNTFGEVASINHNMDEIHFKEKNQNIEKKKKKQMKKQMKNQKLVTAGSNKIIKIFNIVNLSNIQLLQQLADHGQKIIQIIFSLDEKTMYTIDTDKYVIIWNVENILDNVNAGIDFEDSQDIIDVAFTSTGDFFFAICGVKRKINFNEVLTKRCLNSLSFHDFNFIKLTLSQNNKYLAAVNQEGLIVVWDVSQYHIFNLIWYEETFYKILDFQFSPDNQALSILYKEMLVNKNFKNQFCRQEYIKYENCDLFAFSQNDDLLSIVCDQTIYHIDLITNQMINSIAINDARSQDKENSVKTLAMFQNQQLAYKVRQENVDDVMVFYDMFSYQKLFEINICCQLSHLSSDSKWLIEEFKNSIIIRNLENKIKKGGRKKAYNILGQFVKSLTISQKNSLYFYSSQSDKIIVKDLVDEKTNIDFSFKEKNEIPLILVFSQKGKYLIIATNFITLIKIDQNEERKEFISPQSEEYLHIATSYDDKMLGAVSKSTHRILLWNIKTQKLEFNFEAHCNTKLIFSPKAEMLAFGQENKIIFYDYKNNNQLQQLIHEHENEVIDFAFSSNNQYFASLGKNSTIILQNLATSKATKNIALLENARFVLFVDLQILLTASQNIVKIWKIQQDQTLILLATKDTFDIFNIVYQEFARRIIFRVNEFFWRMIVYDFDEFLELTIIKLQNQNKAFTISNDNQLIGYECGKEIKIKRLDGTFNDYQILNENESNALAFSQDNKLLANFETNNCLKIWNLENNQILSKFQLGNIIYRLSFSENGKHLIGRSKNNATIFDVSNSLAILDVYFHQGSFEMQKDNFLAGFRTYDNRTIIQMFRLNQNKAFLPIQEYDQAKVTYSQENYVVVNGYKFTEIFHQKKFNKITTLKNVLAVEFIFCEKLLLVQKQIYSEIGRGEAFNIIVKIMDLENDSEEQLKVIMPSHMELNVPQLIKAQKDIILVCENSIWFFQLVNQKLNFIQRIYLKKIMFLQLSQQHICYKIRQQFICLNLQKIEQKQFLSPHLNSGEIIAVSENQEFLIHFCQRYSTLWNLKEQSQQTMNNIQGEINYNGQVIFLNNHQFIYSDEKKLYLSQIDSFGGSQEFGSTSQIIKKIAYSNKSNLMVTGDDAQNIIVWDVKAKSQVTTFSGHSKKINSIAFSPNCQVIASGGEDQIIRFWNVNLRHNITSNESHLFKIHSLQFSPDGLILASSSLDGKINLWDVQSKRCLCTLPIFRPKFPQNLTFSDDQNYLFSFDDDSIILWNIKNFSNIRFTFVVRSFPFQIYQANIDENNNISFFSNIGYSFSLMYLMEDIQYKNENQTVIDEVQLYQVSQTEPLIAYLRLGKMEIVDLHTKQTQTFPQLNIKFCFFSDNGQQLATVNNELEVQTFSKSNHNKWNKLNLFSLKYQLNYETIINFSFSKDNSQLIILSDTDASFYDIKNAYEGSAILSKEEKEVSYIQRFLLMEDRKTIAIAYEINSLYKGDISFVSVEDFKQVKTLKGYEKYVRCMSASFDNAYFSVGYECEILIWEYQKETLISELLLDSKQIHSIQFLKNNSHILIISQFQLDGKNCIFLKYDHQTKSLSKFNIEGDRYHKISPFGNLIAVYCNKKSCLLKLNFTNFEFEIQENYDFINEQECYYDYMTFNSNQTLLASIEKNRIGEKGHILKIWDIQKQTKVIQVYELKSISIIYSELHFSSDKNQIYFSIGKELIEYNIYNQASPIIYYFDFEISDFSVVNDKIIIKIRKQILLAFKKQYQNLLRRCFFEDNINKQRCIVEDNVHNQRQLFSKNAGVCPSIFVSDETIYTIMYSNTNNQIITYNTKSLKKVNEISFPGNLMSLSNDEKLLVFASETQFGFSDLDKLQNCETIQQFDAGYLIRKFVISQNCKLLATICDLYVTIWDISDQSNPKIKFSLLGKSQYEQFNFDSLYFCRQVEQQLIIINIEKHPQKEIIMKLLCNKNLKGTIKARIIDNNQITVFVSENQLLYNDNNDLKVFRDFSPDLSKFVYSDVSKVLAYITLFKFDHEDKSLNENIYILRLNNLEKQDSIKNAHHQSVLSLSISLDGMLLLSGGEDYSIKIWDTENLSLVARIDNLSNVAEELAFCPDGFYFASGARDGSVSLFILKQNNGNKQFNKKQQSLLENFGNNKIGCVKVFSQQPLLQISKYTQENLKFGPKDQTLAILFDQKK